jgi:hypothetical protein
VTLPRGIATAASQGYERALLALVGSLRCNWPDAPPVIAYDLGMSAEAVQRLRGAGVDVRPVPPFCEHWRRNYAWKFWCYRDVPAETYLWLDAGVVCLRPMPEAFACAEALGYFAVSLYNHPVAPSVPPALAGSLALSAADMDDMISVSSGIHALHKRARAAELVEEGYRLALDEDNLRAVRPEHRHDQAVLTLLLNKHFGPPVLADYHIYAHHDPDGPGHASRQRLWVHRRKLSHADTDYFIEHLRGGAPRRELSRIPDPGRGSVLFRLRVAIAKLRGRYPGDGRVDIDTNISDGLKD